MLHHASSSSSKIYYTVPTMHMHSINTKSYNHKIIMRENQTASVTPDLRYLYPSRSVMHSAVQGEYTTARWPPTQRHLCHRPAGGSSGAPPVRDSSRSQAATPRGGPRPTSHRRSQQVTAVPAAHEKPLTAARQPHR